MIHKIYSVYDSKAETYTPPFFQHREAMALRTFADCCNDDGHTFGKHPEDYTLFDLGTYDDDNGCITQDKIISVANGLTLKGI
nr:MAG: nonstructural protein [Microvirus sp.]